MKQLIGKILSEPLSKADAIVCLEGDGQERTKKALELFASEWAPFIIVSGGKDNPPFSIVAEKMADYLIENGVPQEKIIVESKSQNTREQAEEAMKIVKEKGWQKILLIASEFHQARAYLTFLKAMEDLDFKIAILNAPVKDECASLMAQEFKKIEEYQKKGHVSTIEEAIEYQKWKEQQ